jgi:TolB-like protein
MRFRNTLAFSPDRIVLSFSRPPGPACDTIRRARRWGLKLLFSFEDFVLDCDRRELRRGAAIVPIEPKVFDFLTYVIQNRERVVSKDELIAAVWQGRIVSDSALATCINAVRSAVADDGEQQRLLKTLARKGLRFIGNVKQDDHQPVGIPIADPRSAATNPPLALPDKPSIAVLPFQNIGSDPEQEYFADGFVEDVISGLSRIKWLFVIARNSSFAYKGKPVDVRQVGRELGVRYVLEGSVRKAGDRVRVSGQLIETQSGNHLWAERYERVYADIFALQDDLTMNVVGAIEPSLRKVEIERVRRKRPDSLDAYDLVLRALPFSYGHSEDDAAKAVPLLEKALELEPGYVAAHAPLAWCYLGRFRSGRCEVDRAAALHHARAAIAGGTDDATALAIAGFIVALIERDPTTAFTIFDRALELSSSNIFALSCSALIMSFLGRTKPAIERAQHAIRLSPFDSLNYLAYNALAISHFSTGQYEASRDAARLSVQLNPRFSVCHLFLAAALLRLGDQKEAKRVAQRVLVLDSAFTIRRFSVLAGFERAVFDPLADAWREMGLPEA